ncbi:IS4-like element ISSav1 family transposase, partial [Streptomyces sp. NPDC004227]
MVDAVESRPGTDPDRTSFTIALRTAAEQVITARAILEPADGHGGIAQAVLAALLPPRRARTSARLVKCPISQYTVASQERPRKRRRITSVHVAIHRRDETEPDDLGFRERTLRLL